MRAAAYSSLPLGGALVVVFLGLASATLYDELLLDDLYKRLSQLEDNYMIDEDDYGAQPMWADSIPLDSRDSGQADIRDPEYLEHSASKGGFQYISGGAGEGAQHLTPEGTQNNTQEVKSDEALPFYCHPPNPCPKGYTEKDGCQTTIKDTAEAQRNWIQGMMRHNLCTCDEEHMFSCPRGLDTMNMEKGHESRDDLDKVLDSLLGGEKYGVNPYAKGSKRESLVAKKAPGLFAGDGGAQEFGVPVVGDNPYMDGDNIGTVAKKGMGLMKK